MKSTLAILTLALGALLATGCAQTSCSKCKSCGPCGGGGAPPLGAMLGAGGPSGCPNGNCPNHGPLRTAMFGGGGIGGDAGMYGGEPGYLNSWRLGWQRGATNHIARVPRGYLDYGEPGPPSATYGYPYYTLRGPRDFLMNNPQPIGY